MNSLKEKEYNNPVGATRRVAPTKERIFVLNNITELKTLKIVQYNKDISALSKN